MLFKSENLNKIKSGEQTLTFRKWKRPSARTGSLIHTAIGRLKIISVEIIDISKITENEAIKAGAKTRAELISELNNHEGELYRIQVEYHSPDPRIVLRETVFKNENEFEKILSRLNRMDSRSDSGPWTIDILNLIKEHPQMRALDLAEKMKKEKTWFKLSVRKLKNLGLTISRGIGYQISPRGISFLEFYDSKK